MVARLQTEKGFHNSVESFEGKQCGTGARCKMNIDAHKSLFHGDTVTKSCFFLCVTFWRNVSMHQKTSDRFVAPRNA